MPQFDPALQAHLESRATTLCHAWAIERQDGVGFYFTDHDLDLEFDGKTFRADTGVSGLALTQTTGLAVDNTEAMGALSHISIREDEIEQGRFDEAEVIGWLVNWQDTSQRWLNFRGTIGEVTRADGAFRAELRGLTEALNRPIGRVYQKPCTAILGDKTCQFDLTEAGYFRDLPVQDVKDAQTFTWNNFLGFDVGWFTRGRLEVLDGPAKGLWQMVKHDHIVDGRRVIELWEPIRGAIGPETMVKLIAGCDKRMETCRLKFNNFINFQGFPDLPNEDWVVATPKSAALNGGGSLR